MSFLKLSGVTFGYGTATTVLSDVSVEIDEKDRLALVGANGAGKTTLFRLIMGLIRPQSGAIDMEGETVKEDRDWRALRRRIGLVFQDPDDQLFCPTLLEDVAFGPMNMDVGKKEAREKALSTLRSLGIENLADHPPYTLSGGQKKLGALATVLSMGPSFMLLDEPSAGLDENATGTLVETLSVFPGGFIISSHDQGFLDSMSLEKISLRQGRLHR